jgi:hypothetical protein
VLAAVSLHVTVLFLLITRFDYHDLISVRHSMILAGLTLPFSAAGIMTLLEAAPERRRGMAAAVVCVALFGPTLPYLLISQGADMLAVRRAGEWIRATAGGGQRILTTRNLAVYYANGVPLWSPREPDIERILAEARANRPRWLVFEERRMVRDEPAFFQNLQSASVPNERLELAHEAPGPRANARVLVYRYEVRSAGL